MCKMKTIKIIVSNTVHVISDKYIYHWKQLHKRSNLKETSWNNWRGKSNQEPYNGDITYLRKTKVENLGL